MMRALIGTPESRSADAVDLMRQAVALEAAAGGAAHPTAVMSLGNALARDAQFDEAATILLDAWRVRGRASWSASVDLQTAGSLALSLLHLDRVTEFDALLRDAGPLADEVEKAWRDAAAPVVAMLRVVQGRRRYLQARFAEAVPMLARASALAEASGRLSYQVLALSFLADAELAVGERPAARTALSRARAIVDNEPVAPFAVGVLHEEQRIGRAAARSATRAGAVGEELSDRELSILRALAGTATQREIGAALFLSVNTVKAYTKSLYRKLGVASRQDAVVTARRLGLI